MKKVIAVEPYKKKEDLIFQQSVFEAWSDLGGRVIYTMYPPRFLHFYISRFDYIHFNKNKREARLKFMGGGCPEIKAFPDNLKYEIIPMFWDCWPNVFEKVCSFLQRNKVKTAIFTSSMTAELIKKKFPKMNVLFVTEGIDISLYNEGELLKNRKIDLIEFGRSNKKIVNSEYLDTRLKHLDSKNGERLFPDFEEFSKALSNSKVTITLPRCDTHPEVAGNIETLTQRYWECMLSRIIMLGRAPFELIDLIGYNPVININLGNADEQVLEILNSIDKYQDLVNRNRAMALKMASWKLRVREIMSFLISNGYEI